MLVRREMFFVTIFLLFLSPVLSAADIYVSSSDGINNTSCWTGGVQTPCATLDLAIQGAATAVQGGGGVQCKSGTVIYLLPGTYTATVLEQQLISNNVLENENEHVMITVPRSSTNLVKYTDTSAAVEYNCPQLNIEFVKSSLRCSQGSCECLKFTASVTDCRGEVFDWTNELKICINDSTSNCTSETITCDCGGYYDGYYDCENNDYPIFCYELSSFCHDNIDTPEMTFYFSTVGLITLSTNVTVNVTRRWLYPTMCSLDQTYCPYYNTLNCFTSYCCDEPVCAYNANFSIFCPICPSGNGVPINKIKQCVDCHHYLSSILVFVGIEILPMTIIVLLIIAFNIQLTNGSMNGLVFYSQIAFVIYSDYVLLNSSYTNYQTDDLFASPCNVFSLDFTPFLGNYSLCIAPHMSPLGAISFWYVVGFYPLLLLLLLYVWITLYDKGYKCVVLVTRPFHRCMARFWSMTGIEPSFTHSIASIYILCFTQLAATSFKILRFRLQYSDSHYSDSQYSDSGRLLFFFYDAKQPYFGAIHVLASTFAILVLLFLILLPTLYILFYQFKWFHKLLDCLHLRKQLLISLGDVFTGPYKNGSENTFDYRFFAGFYLLLKILIFFCQFLLFFKWSESSLVFSSFFIVSVMQCCLVLLLALMVFVFRPFQRNVHNFCEALVLVFVAFLFIYYIIVNLKVENENYDEDSYINGSILLLFFNGLLFLILLIYIMYQLCRMLIHCGNYCLRHNHTIRVQEQEDQPLAVNDDDWVADRMENPQEYDEQHVPFRLDDLSVEYPQDNTVAANYGSINNNKTVHTKNSSL